MGRERASDSSKQFCVLFAKAITVPAANDLPSANTVGRSGTHSVFDVLSRTIPNATRDHNFAGVTLTELNKALEKDGFQRVRLRSIGKRITVSDASFYRYGGRRWRNPANSDDMVLLAHAWERITRICEPAFGTSICSLSRLCEILSGIIAAEAVLKAPRGSWRRATNVVKTSYTSIRATPMGTSSDDWSDAETASYPTSPCSPCHTSAEIQDPTLEAFAEALPAPIFTAVLPSFNTDICADQSTEVAEPSPTLLHAVCGVEDSGVLFPEGLMAMIGENR